MSGNRLNSNLESYGWHMAVGITQEAMNYMIDQFMSPYLEDQDGEEYVKVFVTNSSGHVVETDYDAFVAACGVDPFDLSHGTPKDDQDVQALHNHRFVYGFKAVQGQPLDFYLQEDEDTAYERLAWEIPYVHLNKDYQQKVAFNIVFKDLIYVRYPESDEEGLIVLWQNEPDENDQLNMPLVFPVCVDLVLSNGGAFSTLPADIQNKVRHWNPGASFNIQQLYVDLNTISGINLPRIVIENRKGEEFNDFLTGYIAYLKNSLLTSGEGDILLGSAVKVHERPGASSLTPTALDFMTNCSRDSGKRWRNYKPDQNRYPAPKVSSSTNTLNWLAMTGEHPSIPRLRSFDWNWIVPEKGEEEQALPHGVMAINGEVFADRLNNMLSSNLNRVCATPEIDVWNEGTGVAWRWNITFDNSPKRFEYNKGHRNILSFSFQHTTNDECGKSSGFSWESAKDTFRESLEITIDYRVNVDVYCEDHTIRIVTHAVAHLVVDYSVVPNQSGDIVNLTAVDYYDLAVDDTGVIQVTHRHDATEDNSNDFDMNFFIRTFTNMEDKVRHAKTSVNSKATGYMSNYQAMMTSLLATPSFFILSGGKTFMFEDVEFSKYSDLLSYITYLDTN